MPTPHPWDFWRPGYCANSGRIPLILKLNNHDVLHDEKNPLPSVTGSVKDALLWLGCSAVGFTIYPGSSHCNAMYEQLRAIAEDAKDCGLAVVVWSYPRGSVLSKEGETAIDVVAYAAQIAAQLGAHFIKVKLPTAHLDRLRQRRCTNRPRFRSRPWRSGLSMWCRVRSMGAALSFSQEGPRARTITCLRRRAPFVTAAGLAPSLGGTRSSGRKRRR